MLERLQEHQLAQSPEKYEWHMSKVNFLCYIISENGIEMDQKKISVTPDTLVYTFDYSRSRGIGGTNHRSNRESAAPSAATPPASARGLLLLLYFMRRMQPIGYGVAIYILGLKPFVVLMSIQFLIKHSVEVLLLFSSDSPCYLPRIVLSAAYK